MDMKHNIISNTLSKNIQPRGPLSKQVYLVATVKLQRDYVIFQGNNILLTLCMNGYTTEFRTGPRIGIHTWWWVHWYPIEAGVFIAMLIGRVIGWFHEPDLRQKGKSENLTDGSKRFWHRVFTFPIFGVWWSDWHLYNVPKIQAMSGFSPPTA